MRFFLNHRFLLLLAFAIRFAFGVYSHPPQLQLYSDMANYNRIADAILANQWDVNHFFQPVGFPLIVSLFKLLGQHWGYLIGLFHAVISTLTLWLMWDVTKNVTGEKWAKIILLIGCL